MNPRLKAVLDKLGICVCSRKKIEEREMSHKRIKLPAFLFSQKANLMGRHKRVRAGGGGDDTMMMKFSYGRWTSEWLKQLCDTFEKCVKIICVYVGWPSSLELSF